MRIKWCFLWIQIWRFGRNVPSGVAALSSLQDSQDWADQQLFWRGPDEIFWRGGGSEPLVRCLAVHFYDLGVPLPSQRPLNSHFQKVTFRWRFDPKVSTPERLQVTTPPRLFWCRRPWPEVFCKYFGQTKLGLILCTLNNGWGGGVL